MTTFRTRSEIRLEELEGLKRRLTQAEGEELRRCLHAIYMRHWRIEQSLHGRVGGELLEVQKRGRVEANAIAYRMERATDKERSIDHADDWQDQAREASAKLRDAILNAQERAASNQVVRRFG